MNGLRDHGNGTAHEGRRDLRIMKAAAIAALLAVSASAVQASDPRLQKQVHYGGDTEFDACGGSGRVKGLDPQGDNFLAVRAGPGTTFAEVARLAEGTEVAICETSGKWLGVVFAPGGIEPDCGTSSPRAERSVYSGPCQAGWVSERFIGDLAG